MKIRFTIVTAFFVITSFFTTVAQAATWYASPTGSAQASGTSDADPTDLVTAISTLAQDGDTLQLASGTYLLSDSIRINRAVHIIGAGRGQSILNGSGLAPIETGLLVTATGGEFEIEEITFDGFSTSTGINCNPNTQCNIHDMEFLGDQHTAIASNALSLTVQNSLFENLANALSITTNTANATITISNNTFNTISSSGVRILSENGIHGTVTANNFTNASEAVHVWSRSQAPGGDIKITENTINGGAYGFKLFGHSYYMSDFNNVSFENNTIENATNSVHLHYVDGFKLEKNILKNARYKNIVMQDTKNLLISKNRIEGAGESGIDAGTNCTDITIINNVILKNMYGITMWGSSSGKIGYNTFINSNNSTIRVYSDLSVMIANNIIYGTQSGNGLWTTSAATEVCFNDFYDNAGGDLSGPYTDMGHNLFVAPQFKNMDNPQLKVTSPLINAGGYYFIETDYLDQRRFSKKARQVTDIGAFEYK
ncbi:right-handed parallel beta-helix repeat-containing protein [bacterium]|nr:right-handed parallel beta-helix repeat-containing protein [bacterium]